jgi:ATP-dependent helicase/nuclease subunit A
VRLHYVAATRARDLLVVSAHHKEGRPSIGARTWSGCRAAPSLWRPFERRGDERYQAVPPTQLRLSADSYDTEVEQWDRQQAEILAGVEREATVSATGLAERLRPVGDSTPPLTGPDHRLVGEEPDPERQPWRRGRAGTRVGAAVHAVLQHVSLDGEQEGAADGEPGPRQVELRHLAGLFAEQEGVSHLTETVVELARQALTAPVMDLARRSRHWRELHVARPVGTVLVEGFIDLCIDGPDGLTIVDYKTDPVTTVEAATAKVADHRIQGAVYALALEHVTGRPVVDCRFVFVGPAGVIEQSLPDLAAARAEALAALEAVG